jgi:hypothetical protein
MAAGKYELYDGEKLRLTKAVIATGTVIEAGDLVAISAGLIIKAVAASTAVAWCPDGHAASSGTLVDVTVGNDFTIKTTAESAFAISYKGGEYDINDTTQTIDWDASTTDVLKIGISADQAAADATTGIVVKINKPLF